MTSSSKAHLVLHSVSNSGQPGAIGKLQAWLNTSNQQVSIFLLFPMNSNLKFVLWCAPSLLCFVDYCLWGKESRSSITWSHWFPNYWAKDGREMGYNTAFGNTHTSLLQCLGPAIDLTLCHPPASVNQRYTVSHHRGSIWLISKANIHWQIYLLQIYLKVAPWGLIAHERCSNLLKVPGRVSAISPLLQQPLLFRKSPKEKVV